MFKTVFVQQFSLGIGISSTDPSLLYVTELPFPPTLDIRVMVTGYECMPKEVYWYPEKSCFLCYLQAYEGREDNQAAWELVDEMLEKGWIRGSGYDYVQGNLPSHGEKRPVGYRRCNRCNNRRENLAGLPYNCSRCNADDWSDVIHDK